MGSHDLNHREEKHIQQDRGRQWGWDLSARFYERAYFYISHQLDQDMFDFLGVRAKNAVVVDCGCGPGVVAEKFLIRGAAKIFAIDANQEMLKRLRARFESQSGGHKVVPIQAPYNGNILRQIHKENMQGRGFDVVLFKRSLYLPRPRALEVLRQALPLLAPGGLIVVIHAEKNLWRYCFQTPWILARHSVHHIANRFISRVLERVGGEEYTLHTKRELTDLLREAAGENEVVQIESEQCAFNLVCIIKKSESRRQIPGK